MTPASTSLAPSLPAYVRDLGHGVHAIDTGFFRPEFDASYLIVEAGRAAFVDTGINDSVPRLLGAVAALGLEPDAVDWVIATHVHLDHAGGVGRLMRRLPNARLVVHPQGAPHLIDPARLLQGARAVYGDAEVARTYGDVIGVPPERVLRSADGQTIDLAGRRLELLDTPGHARHHHCVWDERSRGFFTGDTFGLSYREFDTDRGVWIMPTTTPVQFDPDAMRRSIDRMLGYGPDYLYLTHYGRIAEPARLGRLLLEQLDAMVALAIGLPIDAERHQAMKDGFLRIHLQSLRDHGIRLDSGRIADLLVLDLELNAQGMAVWLDRRNRQAPAQQRA